MKRGSVVKYGISYAGIFLRLFQVIAFPPSFECSLGHIDYVILLLVEREESIRVSRIVS